MSYIAFDLDAFEDAEKAARQAAIDADKVMAGLLRLWRHCWRKKTDKVEAEELGAFFAGADPRLRAALARAGFIELGAAGVDRVRGAERYLRISQARSKGGHAAKNNLLQGKKSAAEASRLAPGSLPAAAGDQPETAPGCGPALTASSEHSNSEQRISLPRTKRAAKVDAPDPRHQPLVDGLDLTFRRKRGIGYPWGGIDFAVIKRLLKRRPSHEDALWVPALLGAFERAMDATHPDCRSLEAFERDLPRYLGTGPPAATAPAKGASWTQAQLGDDRGFLEGLSDGL